MFYRLIAQEDTKGKLYVPVQSFKSSLVVDREAFVIKAGRKIKEVEIVPQPKLQSNELQLSRDVLESLCIPANIKYQAKLEKNSLRLGPIIGLLMAKNNKNLTKGRLKELMEYCQIYSKINGLVIAMSVEDIDFETHSVKGYYYNGESGSGGSKWEEGIFPFPDSIFHRINLPEDMRLRLKEESNNKIFNSNYFNKWQFWKIVSPHAEVSKNIPYTRLLYSVDDIDNVIEKYGTAYLKPLSGTLSRGLYKCLKEGDGYKLQSKQGEAVLENSSKEELESFTENILKNHRYLVQQGLLPVKVDDRHLDFRVMMQKDQTQMWKCTGIVAFIGRRGDICTNWGYTADYEKLMSEYFNFSQREIYIKKQEIVSACRKVCELLDSTGENYGDFGFDVLLDDKFKVWILEANKRHYHSVPLWNNDVQTFYELKANTMKYAAALSGFDVY